MREKVFSPILQMGKLRLKVTEGHRKNPNFHLTCLGLLEGLP